MEWELSLNWTSQSQIKFSFIKNRRSRKADMKFLSFKLNSCIFIGSFLCLFSLFFFSSFNALVVFLVNLHEILFCSIWLRMKWKKKIQEKLEEIFFYFPFEWTYIIAIAKLFSHTRCLILQKKKLLFSSFLKAKKRK